MRMMSSLHRNSTKSLVGRRAAGVALNQPLLAINKVAVVVGKIPVGSVAVPTAKVAPVPVTVVSEMANSLTATRPVTLNNLKVPMEPGSPDCAPLKATRLPAGIPTPAIIDHLSPSSIMSGYVTGGWGVNMN